MSRALQQIATAACGSAQAKAVFFDVDFTLIYPGPTFQGEGYERFCARHGIAVDRSRFPHAVRAASSILNDQQQHVYDADIFVRYTGRIIEEMGGSGPHVEACAREIYAEWAACQHFFLYDDVAPALRALATRGFKIGLISNSHRCLASFQQHFELEGLITAAVSSSEHGYLKPHPSIFEAALKLAGVAAGESVMVGDSFPHDIEGARRVGMRGVLVHRADAPPVDAPDVPIIKDLSELLPLL
jgi:HAD superfamily hydrolase (TIGR01662 family)